MKDGAFVLRNKVMDFMEEHTDKYIQFFNADAMHTTWDAYIKLNREHTTWGDNLCIQGMVDYLEVPLSLITNIEGQEDVCITPTTSQACISPIVLAYNDGLHYEAVGLIEDRDGAYQSKGQTQHFQSNRQSPRPAPPKQQS
jgi:hypothetical protein